MRIPTLATLFALSLAGCTQADDPALNQTESQKMEITGGTTDSGDPAVVMIEAAYGTTTMICSGTVIAPRIVLTAAHCFLDSGGMATSVKVTGLPAVQSWIIHPSYAWSEHYNPYDVAVLVLKGDAGIAPLPYHAGAPDASWVGQTTRLVGFGKTAPAVDDDEVKRQVATPIVDVETTYLTVKGNQNCGGDSGGPMLMNRGGVETIVGVSASANPDCTSLGVYGRIDIVLSFINGWVASSGTSGDTSMGGGGGVPHVVTGGGGGGGCSFGGAAGSAHSLGLLAIALAALVRRRRD